MYKRTSAHQIILCFRSRYKVPWATEEATRTHLRSIQDQKHKTAAPRLHNMSMTPNFCKFGDIDEILEIELDREILDEFEDFTPGTPQYTPLTVPLENTSLPPHRWGQINTRVAAPNPGNAPMSPSGGYSIPWGCAQIGAGPSSSARPPLMGIPPVLDLSGDIPLGAPHGKGLLLTRPPGVSGYRSEF